MKRVRSFDIRFLTLPSERSQAASFADVYASISKAVLPAAAAVPGVPLESWHATCDLVQSRWEASTDLLAVVLDSTSKRIVACFSDVNLADRSMPGQHTAAEDEDEDAADGYTVLNPTWQSLKMVPSDGGLYENRNVRDFFWEQIEGAKRDVPFRLSYLERFADRHQGIAYPMSMVRDWLAARTARVL